MPRLMALRRTAQDDGVVAMLVSVVFGSIVFVALLALVVDIGTMQVERRELQNGAESGVVAAAYQCSLTPSNCGSAATYAAHTAAQAEANLNARDGASAVASLCGSSVAVSSSVLLPCPAGDLRNCPVTPRSADAPNWLRVTTSTLTGAGNTFLPQFFSQRLAGSSPKTVRACAQATWMAPGELLPSVPMALGADCFTNQGGLAPLPPYSAGNEPITYEQALVLGTDSKPARRCEVSSSRPGGFGWVTTSTIGSDQCAVNLKFGWSQSNTGASLSTGTCQDKMKALVNATETSNNKYTPDFYNRIAYIPVFDSTNSSTGAYHISGFAAFYMTGFQVPSLGKQGSPRDPNNACANNSVCIYGWFVQSTIIAPNAAVPSSTPPDPSQVNYSFSVVRPVG